MLVRAQNRYELAWVLRCTRLECQALNKIKRKSEITQGKNQQQTNKQTVDRSVPISTYILSRLNVSYEPTAATDFAGRCCFTATLAAMKAAPRYQECHCIWYHLLAPADIDVNGSAFSSFLVQEIVWKHTSLWYALVDCWPWILLCSLFPISGRTVDARFMPMSVYAARFLHCECDSKNQ